MKPGGVVSLKKINSVAFLKNNKLYLLMFFTLIIGIIIGCISISGGKADGFGGKVFDFYINTRQNSNFVNILFSSLFCYALVCFAYFIFGTSVIGVVLSPLMCCVIGIYFSSLAAYSYKEFGLKGIAFNAIILIPSALSFIVCAFFAARATFNYSSIMLRISLPKSRISNISGEFKAYCGKFLLITLLCLIASLVDAAVSTSFLKYFSF